MVLCTSTHAKTHRDDAHDVLWCVFSTVTPRVLQDMLLRNDVKSTPGFGKSKVKKISLLHLLIRSLLSDERIKMPKRGVNWAFLKINCKN
jgi:hypothetical protein